MASPLIISQPGLVLAQSVLTEGIYPNFYSEAWESGTAAVLGTIITTAFEPKNMRMLTPAQGQILDIASMVQNQAMYSILGNIYGGVPGRSFALPDLAGALTLGTQPSNPNEDPIGTVVGEAGNAVNLVQNQMPAMLGGTSEPIFNIQYGQKLQYLIQVRGDFPTGTPVTNETLGTIYAYTGERIPDGFMQAAGQLLSIQQFTALFSLVGTTYGGDGITTFALPDLRNIVPIGAGGDYELGEVIGSTNIVLNPATVPSAPDAQTADIPISTMQPSLAVNFLINTFGTYNYLGFGEATLGQVIMYAGTYVPEGWTLAQGQELPISDYEALFQLIGTQFGGDGVNTFALPDLRNRSIIASGGDSNLAIGDVLGQANVAVSQDNLPEITVSVPGVFLTDDSGASNLDHVTNAFSVNVSAAWPGAQVEFSADGRTWSTSYTAQEGLNSLYVRQIDVLGQVSATSQPLTFTLDSTAPVMPTILIDRFVLASTVGESGIPQTASGSLSLIDIEPGALVQYSIDGGVTWSERFQAVEGRNSVMTRQMDRAGNVSDSSAPFVFDLVGAVDQPAEVWAVRNSSGAVSAYVQEIGVLEKGLGSTLVDTVHFSLQQPLTLPSDLENVVLSGIGAANTVTGHDHANQFIVLEGSWRLDGQGGLDTVILHHNQDDYLIQQSDSSLGLQITLIGPDGKLTLSNIEKIQFADKTLVQSEDGQLQDLYHLYATMLGRTPDFEGLDYWNNEIEQGNSLSQVANHFLDSSDFANRNGQTLNSLEFLDLAYRTLLGRDPDQAGQDYWKAQLDAGANSRGDVWLSIMFSKEGEIFASSHPVIWVPIGAALEMG